MLLGRVWKGDVVMGPGGDSGGDAGDDDVNALGFFGQYNRPSFPPHAFHPSMVW